MSSDIKTILAEYDNKNILYKFLIFVVKDTRANYDHAKYKEIYIKQNKVLKILGDLLLGKEVSKKDIRTAANAAHATASVPSITARDSSVAYATAYAAYAVVNTTTSTVALSAAHATDYAAISTARDSSSARATNAPIAAKQQEYKNYLIKLILKENNIKAEVFDILYKGCL